jgi:esterase
MRLFYRTIGQGPPIVILHGLFGSCDNWLTMGKNIADLGYTVYMIDQRNHGRSPHDLVFNYSVMAADLHEFISDLALQKPVLIGHSMGGKTVMQYALNYPNDFSKIAVIDIAPKFYPVHHYDILQGLNTMPIAALQNRQEADDFLATFEPKISVRQFLLKNLYRNESGLFAWRINLPVITQNIHEIGDQITGLGSVMQPALFMRGEWSSYIQDTDWDDILQLFPNATLDTIAKADHWIQAEQPVDFLESLRGFLAMVQRAI